MRVPDNHKIRVFLADDNLIVREGVRALLATAPDIEVIGVAGSYQELVDGAEKAAPQVLVTDIRMPPSFQREGIEAAKEVRKRHPGTGIVVLSQYDEPDYAIALLSEGAWRPWSGPPARAPTSRPTRKNCSRCWPRAGR